MDMKKWKIFKKPNKHQILEQQLMEKIGYNSNKKAILFI